MTRAKDCLFVCGYSGEKIFPNTWLQLVKNALKPHAVAIKGPAEDIAAWRYCITPSSLAPINQELPHIARQTPPSLPAFFLIKFQKNQLYPNR